MTCMGHGCWSTDDHCSCVQDHAFSTCLMTETEKKKKRKKKTKTLLLTKRCQRQIFDHLCLHIYLFNNLLTSPETWAPLSTLISAASATSCRHIAKLRLGQTSETDTFQFFYLFFSSCRWFSIQNAVKLKPCVHVQVVEIHANLVPGGFFSLSKCCLCNANWNLWAPSWRGGGV